MKKLRILLADDHKILRDGLKLLIENQPDMQVVAEAENGKEAVQRALELNPDVVVMDLSMPELNGLQATEKLKEKRPDIKVLALTVHEDETYMRQLCKAGAAGYILKRSAGEELIKAIHAVSNNQAYFDATLANKAMSRQFGIAKREDSGANDLSPREKEVLTQMASGFSNKEIAGDLHLSVKTVETYKARLGEKLKLRSRAEIVQFALRQGWLTETSSSAKLNGLSQ